MDTNAGSASPASSYSALIASGEVLADQSQADVIALLDQLFHRLVSEKKAKPLGLLDSLRSLFRATPQPPPLKGLYLWGGVGRGKTMMMDQFCACLPSNRRQRMHFHRFMRRVHQGLGKYAGRANPLEHVADELAKRGDVLCFDEFFVSDIGDAMILGEMMKALFDRGVVLVATSNVEPKNLYQNGLQRARFLPAIDLLYAHCDVHEIESGQDFRLRTLQQATLYHYPLGAAADANMAAFYAALITKPGRQDILLRIENRDLRAVRVAGDVVWFDFQEICEGPRSQNDYIELATLFSSVINSDVPVLTAENENAARRFISLVDEFYDRGVKLILSAEVAIAQLYQGERLVFEFQRTQSRLLEMQSEAYLAGAHHALEPGGH